MINWPLDKMRLPQLKWLQQCDICFTFHLLLFQVIRRGDRRPFYAPARYVMEVKTDQARLQVGKSAVVVSI